MQLLLQQVHLYQFFLYIQEYLKATGTFNLDEAFPNLESHPYHWRVDPYETNRYRCQQ